MTSRKIKMGPSFLTEYLEVKDRITHMEYRTSGGCRFQDARVLGTWDDERIGMKSEWLKMTPEDIFSEYIKHPDRSYKFSLITGTRSYSSGTLKNIYLYIEVRDEI